MIICEVQQGARKFVFESRCKIAKDVNVLCDTCYGKAPGIVKDCFEVQDTDSVLFKKYLSLMGATEPLKGIIGVYIPMEWCEARIRKG